MRFVIARSEWACMESCAALCARPKRRAWPMLLCVLFALCAAAEVRPDEPRGVVFSDSSREASDARRAQIDGAARTDARADPRRELTLAQAAREQASAARTDGCAEPRGELTLAQAACDQASAAGTDRRAEPRRELTLAQAAREQASAARDDGRDEPRGELTLAQAAREQASATRNDARGELTLAQVIELALARNPELAAGAFDTLAAEARVEQARLRINPEVSVEMENFAGSGVARGARALETTLTLSQVVELGGKRALRTEVAASDRDLAQVEQDARQLDVLAEVTRRFIAVVAAQERVALATSAKDITQRTLDAISTRVEAARSPEAERSRARIAHTRASIEEQQAQSELRAARFALSALWGGALDSDSHDAPIPAATEREVASSSGTDGIAFTTARGDLMSLDPTQPYEALIARLERNPDFLRFASEARLRDAELQLARAQARPNLAFGGGVRRLNESSDTTLVASFSISLPTFDRNQGAIRAAELRRAQTKAERDAAFIRARATVYGLYQELGASRGRVETLRAEALPQADRALQETEYGYQRGRFSYLELATAQRDQLELKGALIDAAADYHRILAEIERLTGEALTP